MTQVDLPARALLKLAAFAGAVWLLVQLWYVLVLIAIALVLAGTLNPMVTGLEARRVPRALAIVLVATGILVALIVALLVGATLLGVVGALLALPAAAAARMIVRELRAEVEEQRREPAPD